MSPWHIEAVQAQFFYESIHISYKTIHYFREIKSVESEFNDDNIVDKSKNQKEVNEFIKKLTSIDDAAHNAAKLRPPKMMNSPGSGITKIAGTEGSTRNLMSRRSKADAELNLIRKKGLAVKFYRQFTELELDQVHITVLISLICQSWRLYFFFIFTFNVRQ